LPRIAAEAGSCPRGADRLAPTDAGHRDGGEQGVPVSIVLTDVREERRDLLRRPGRLLGLRCLGLDGAIGWIVRQQPVHDGVVQDAMREAVDVRDALGREALEQLGVVMGEGAPVELLERDHPEGWDEMVAQVTLVDGEGGLRQLAQVDPGASTLLEPRRRVVSEAQLRRRDVSAPPAIDEFGLHGVEHPVCGRTGLA
jgi:hypothetical protein